MDRSKSDQFEGGAPPTLYQLAAQAISDGVTYVGAAAVPGSCVVCMEALTEFDGVHLIVLSTDTAGATPNEITFTNRVSVPVTFFLTVDGAERGRATVHPSQPAGRIQIA